MSDSRVSNNAIGTLYEPPEALYIHVPFCVKRCNYCDFHTEAVPANAQALDEWLQQTILDIRRRSKTDDFARIQTIYFGGGTPSHLGLSRLSQLLYTLGLSLRLEPDVECSMEVNPESLTAPMIRDLWALGVNRLSIGVQSFDDQLLSLLGRAHSAADARKAVELASERFDNVSIDVMCGIPDQSTKVLEKTILEAIALGVKHLSVYPLSIEENTPFYAAVQAKTMMEPEADLAAEHMEAAACLLEAAGYQRYEVASYALPGYECRHNSCYWTGKSYLGLGRGAASMLQSGDERVRLFEYSTHTTITEHLTKAQADAEDLMLGMRCSRGVSLEQIQQMSLDGAVVEDTFTRLESVGLVQFKDGFWRPTERGWLCGNELYGALYDLADV